jgi:hypothetical protein
VLVHRLACSIEQLPCKQLLDAESLSDEPRGPRETQTFSHSFSHPRQPDTGHQSQQRLLAFATRVFKAAGRWFESIRGRFSQGLEFAPNPSQGNGFQGGSRWLPLPTRAKL